MQGHEMNVSHHFHVFSFLNAMSDSELSDKFTKVKWRLIQETTYEIPVLDSGTSSLPVQHFSSFSDAYSTPILQQRILPFHFVFRQPTTIILYAVLKVFK